MLVLRTTSTSKAARRLLAIASSTILGACATTPTTSAPPSGSSPAGRFVTCLQDPVMPFHAPKDDSSPPETAANAYDTPETISAIRRHNAAVREACGK